MVRTTASYTLILVASFLLSPAKGCTCFCKSGVYFIIHDDRLRVGAAEVGELFYHLQSLSFDGDIRFDIWFSRRRLVHHFCLFCAMVKPKLSQAIENLSTQFCMLVLVVVFSAQSSVNRNSLTISVLTLVFEVEDRAVSVILKLIPLSKSLSALNSITENIILKRVGPRAHPCLTPFVTGKATELFLHCLAPLHEYHHEIV